MELDALYRRIDAQLERRSQDYPRRVEPLFGELQATIRELAAALRTDAGDVAPETPRDDASPVFVVGYYRSGTTLMLSLLQGHADVVALPGESKHFRSDRSAAVADLHDGWIRRLVSPDGLPPFWTLGRPWEREGDDRYARFTHSLLAYLHANAEGRDTLGLAAAAIAAAQDATPRYWIEKTPGNEMRVTEILAAYPSARFVHIVRDPRATMASILAWNADQHLASVPVAAVELGASLDAARTNVDRVGADRYLVVHYEDLVADPEREMRRVGAFLGLEWGDSLVTPSITANSSSPEKRVPGRVHKLSTSSRLGRIPDATVRAFAAEPARALGYDVPGGSAVLALATRARLSLTLRGRRALARLLRKARRPSRPS